MGEKQGTSRIMGHAAQEAASVCAQSHSVTAKKVSVLVLRGSPRAKVIFFAELNFVSWWIPPTGPSFAIWDHTTVSLFFVPRAALQRSEQ